MANLSKRLNTLLFDELSSREVSMFGGRAFMVNEKMVVSALKNGNLLVRVDAEKHDELLLKPGATQAEMGSGRSMGRGWIEVQADAITDAESLSWWVDIALEYNRLITGV